jgi:hypothetical protein
MELIGMVGAAGISAVILAIVVGQSIRTIIREIRSIRPASELESRQEDTTERLRVNEELAKKLQDRVASLEMRNAVGGGKR